jgi:hypothetical protein
MSWAGLADNQIVSFNNLIDAVATGQFTALTTIPASNEEITKTDASTYVNNWTGYPLFANKASNQLIAKRDLVTTTSTTTSTTEPPTTSTTTTTSAPCECYILYNDDNIDISISFYECGGSTINPECLTCAAASQIYICVQGGQGNNYFVSYGTNCAGGPVPAFTLVALGTNCTTGGDCI